MIYVCEGGGEPWMVLYEGDPPYPLVNGMEVLQGILRPLKTLPKLIADPEVPDEVRRSAIEWLSRHGVNVKIVRTA
jgi:hypothetical protein